MKIEKKTWISLGMVLAGNCLYALAVRLFVLPGNLMSSGTTGIALVVHELTSLSIPAFIFIFNMLMLGIGWWILGRQFAMTTVLSSLFYPAALEALNRLLGNFRFTGDPLLNALFGGIGIGLGLGVVIRAGASTGGMDIPPLILEKHFKIPVSASLWTFDFLILLSQMPFHPAEDLLYGVILIMATSMTLNKVILLGTSKTEVKIVSPSAPEIREEVLQKLDRGVTLLHGEGGFMHKPTEVILSVVSNHELPKLERLARGIDPDCFMIISHVSEVWGRGFSYSKKHEKKEQ